MANQTMNKKGSLLSTFLILVIIISMFSGLYLFWYENLNDVGLDMGEDYNDTYHSLQNRFETLEEQSDSLKEKVSEIEESKSTLAKAWSAIEGGGRALAILITLPVTGIAVMMDLTSLFDSLPDWVIPTIVISITLVIVFALLKAFLGRTEI